MEIFLSKENFQGKTENRIRRFMIICTKKMSIETFTIPRCSNLLLEYRTTMGKFSKYLNQQEEQCNSLYETPMLYLCVTWWQNEKYNRISQKNNQRKQLNIYRNYINHGSQIKTKTSEKHLKGNSPHIRDTHTHLHLFPLENVGEKKIQCDLIFII